MSSHNRWLPWLLERGLCDPETAADYVGRKLLSPELFAQAHEEYQRITANYAAPRHAGFTLRKPSQRTLLEIWHIGFGEANISYGLCVADPNLYWTDPADRQPLIVRYGFPPGEQIECPGLVPSEGTITQPEFDQLLEPLKHLQVPPCPGEEAIVCDGAIYGFNVVLGSTSFSYTWHTIPPAGWEPVAEWLHGVIYHLRQLTNAPFP